MSLPHFLVTLRHTCWPTETALVNNFHIPKSTATSSYSRIWHSWLLLPSRNLLLLVFTKSCFLLVFSLPDWSVPLVYLVYLAYCLLLHPTCKCDFPEPNPVLCFCLYLSLSLFSSAFCPWLILPGSTDLNIIFILMTPKFLSLLLTSPPWVLDPNTLLPTWWIYLDF